MGKWGCDTGKPFYEPPVVASQAKKGSEFGWGCWCGPTGDGRCFASISVNTVLCDVETNEGGFLCPNLTLGFLQPHIGLAEGVEDLAYMMFVFLLCLGKD